MKRPHGWGERQVNAFAKEFANSAVGRAWWTFIDDVRDALLTHFVALKVGGNHRDVTVSDMLALRGAVADRLTAKHRMRIDRATAEADALAYLTTDEYEIPNKASKS